MTASQDFSDQCAISSRNPPDHGVAGTAPCPTGWQRERRPCGPVWLCFGQTDGNPGVYLRCSAENAPNADLVCEPWEVTHYTGGVRGIRAHLRGMKLAVEDFSRTFHNWFEALEVGCGIEVTVDTGILTEGHPANIAPRLREAGFAKIEANAETNEITKITATKLTRKNERQVAPELSGIRPDHLARYELACQYLAPDSKVGDFACGVGYGANTLASQDRLLSVVGADIDAGAIEYAQLHYQSPKATFVAADLFELKLEPGGLDMITSFETIEHVENAAALLAAFNKALKPGGTLLCSTPNEEVVPHASFGNPFHHRHYTPREFAELLETAGFEVIGRYTQTDRQSRSMLDGWAGIYNTAVCRKVAPPRHIQSALITAPRVDKPAKPGRGRRKIFLSIAKSLRRPQLLRAALRHRVHYHAHWRVRYHRLLALACRLNGKQFVADLDWHGYADLRWPVIAATNPELGKKVVIRKFPREFVFAFEPATDSASPRSWAGAEYRNVALSGIDLWEVCKTSIVKELGHLPGTEPTAAEARVIAKYFRWATDCTRGVCRYLDKVKPHSVIIFQGAFFDSRVVLECAKQRGIRIVSVENSLLGNYAFVDSHSGFILNRHSLAERGRELYRRHPELHGDIDPLRFWESQLPLKSVQHRTGGTDIETLNLPAGKKIILLLGQVATDASIVLDSTIYQSTTDFIIAVADVAARHPDWFLVVRLHPKEAWHIDNRERKDGPGEYVWDNTLEALKASGYPLPPNCLLVSGPHISTHELMERADVGLTINSQAGLEMLLLGKPVVTAGRCTYAGHGFTFDVTHRGELESRIIKAMETGLTPEARQEIEAFSRYLFGHYLLPKDPALAAQRSERLREIFGLHASR